MTEKTRDCAGERKFLRRRLRGDETLAQCDQFQKGAVELDDVVFRAPGMTIARPDLEAEPAKQVGLGVEIVGGNDDMIEGAGQFCSRGRRGRDMLDYGTFPVAPWPRDRQENLT